MYVLNSLRPAKSELIMLVLHILVDSIRSGVQLQDEGPITKWVAKRLSVCGVYSSIYRIKMHFPIRGSGHSRTTAKPRAENSRLAIIAIACRFDGF